MDIKDKPIGNIERNKLNKRILINWINKTSLEKIPLNQFGRASRGPILKNLGIHGSKDHKDIKKVFASLDEALGKDPRYPQSRKYNDEENSVLNRKIAELENKLALLTNELAVYKKHDKLIKHLIETGRLLK